MSTINERIRILRESTGLGRTLFCRKLGLKESTLTAIESGRRMPGAEILMTIVGAYPVHSHWLMTGKVNSKLVQTRPKKAPESK